MLVEIVQNGRVLKSYSYEGRFYVEAPPEGEYQIRLKSPRSRARTPNAPTNRLLAVISVDGINVVNGEKAGFSGPGYVLLPGQTVEIPGWRRSNSEVAAFEFSAKDDSYTAQVGNGTSNTGVIGVAVFEEKAPVYVAPPVQVSSPRLGGRFETESARGKGFDPIGDGLARGMTLDSMPWNINDDGPVCSTALPASAAAAAAEASDYEGIPISANSALDRFRSTPMGRSTSMGDGILRRRRETVPELGTGYGEKKKMYTEETTFLRASEVPSTVITLQYAVREKLVEWGVPVTTEPPSVNPFPASLPGSVPAPSGWRG